MTDLTVLWRRLDAPGHDSARLFQQGAHWHLAGTAVFAQDGQPCRLDYRVVCDVAWQTLSADVVGWLGDETIGIQLSAGPDRRWRLNGAEAPQVAGCVDVDLGFSPATNLLPIRRLGLAVGEEAGVRAAWLGLPGLTFEPLDQLYRRDGEFTYHYESGGGSFAAELQVNTAGFVVRYPGLWQVESSA